MTDLPLDGLPVVGAAEVELTADGLVLHRLPASARAQSPKAALLNPER